MMIIPASLIKTEDDRGYYVYVHIDPTTKKPFYVGKGSGKRAFQISKRGDEWLSVYRKIKSQGAIHEVRIIHSGLIAKDAFKKEGELIKSLKAKKIRLVNETGASNIGRRLVGFAGAASFGDFVRIRRIKQGYTQTDLSKIAKIPQTTISKIECDAICATLKTASIILAALNAHLSYEEI